MANPNPFITPGTASGTPIVPANGGPPVIKPPVATPGTNPLVPPNGVGPWSALSPPTAAGEPPSPFVTPGTGAGAPTGTSPFLPSQTLSQTAPTSPSVLGPNPHPPPTPPPAPPPTPPPAEVPPVPPPSVQPPSQFGDLTQPATWMALVGNSAQLSTWVKQYLGPNADPGLVQYYVQAIQKSPGANPSEQAGSAQYWQQKIAQDPSLTGQPGGSSGGSSGTDLTQFNPALGNTDQYNSLFNQLMGRSNESLNISPQDPIIANQVNAYSAQQQRSARDYLSGLAEKEGPEANLAGETRMANEQTAQAVGGMQAQLMQNELTARRTEIQNALQEMGGMLTQEQQLQLQQELGLINASLQQTQSNNYWNFVNSTGVAP